MRVCRANAATVQTIVGVVLSDPLFRWQLTPAQRQDKQQGGGDAGDDGDEGGGGGGGGGGARGRRGRERATAGAATHDPAVGSRSAALRLSTRAPAVLALPTPPKDRKK